MPNRKNNNNRKKEKPVTIERVRRLLDERVVPKQVRYTVSADCRGTIAVADVDVVAFTMAQGSTAATRIGNSIRIKKLMLKFFSFPNPSATILPYRVRFMVFRRVSPGNTDITASEVARYYDNGASYFAGTGVPLDAIAAVNPDLFVTMVDHISPVMQWRSNNTIDGSPALNTDISPQLFAVELEIPYYRNRLIHYNDGDTGAEEVFFCCAQAISCSTGYGNAAGTVCAETAFQVLLDYVDA